ncbi:hypothetical protein JCM10213_000869 [Rhodosporidiobolus nylandii]
MQWSNASSQPLQTLPPSPFHQPHLLSSPSHAPPHQPLATPSPHAVAFGQIPGSQPGVLGWGVGMSAANGGGAGFGFARGGGARSQTPTSVGWGSAAGPSSPAQMPQQTPSNSRRRRRSATPESSDDEGTHRASTARPVRPLLSSAKRARTAGDAVGLGAGGLSLASANSTAVGDLGKALASLDKPSLLNVFSKLLTTSPHLAPTIAALLPTPSLSSILDMLTTLERSVLAALPTGAFLRPDYILSRIRAPLEEYVSDTRRYLGLFVPPQPGTSATSEEDLTHPSTAFQFLHALTASLIRLEVAMPPSPPSSATNPATANPLASHLLPALLNAWHLFLSRLSASINQHGRVLPSSLINGWFTKLDELAPLAPSPFDAFRAGGAQPHSEVRRLMEGVRDRARKEVGWLVGFKAAPGAPATGMGMEAEEEL